MERIVVGYDGSTTSEHALEAACRLAVALGASVTVLTAASDRLLREDGVLTLAADEELGKRVAERGAARARALGVKEVFTRVTVEAPDDALTFACSEGYDLLVVGHRGHGGIRDLLLGSTAKSVVDRVGCSVLVVR